MENLEKNTKKEIEKFCENSESVISDFWERDLKVKKDVLKFRLKEIKENLKNIDLQTEHAFFNNLKEMNKEIEKNTDDVKILKSIEKMYYFLCDNLLLNK